MNKIALILLAVLVIIGAAYMVNQSSKNQQQPTITQATPTEEVVKKEATEAAEDKMIKKEIMIDVTSAGYDRKSIEIEKGTKVIWVNKSGKTANVSSAVHPTHLVYPALNLGNFEDGESVSLVFDAPGTYKYHNHLNPSQSGSITVN